METVPLRLKLQITWERITSWIKTFTKLHPNIERAWVEYLDDEGEYVEEDLTVQFIENQKEFTWSCGVPPSRLGVDYRINSRLYTIYYREGSSFPPFPLDECKIYPQLIRATLHSETGNHDVTELAKRYAGPRGDFFKSADNPTIITDPLELLFPFNPNPETYKTLTTMDTFMQIKQFI